MKLTDEQVMIQDMARAFAMDQLRPHAARWEGEGMLDRGILKALGDLGFGGIYT